jgi:hypothetical protein
LVTSDGVDPLWRRNLLRPRSSQNHHSADAASP